ncbi:MAG: hypothetical protein GY854_06485, partial [Deltaproteobacteria bacterium]|nr:hypothetical protein [Deltaproteobacteria bacterium]
MIISRKRRVHRRPIHGALEALAKLSAILIILAIGWPVYWTVFAPRVQMPPPIEARYGSLQSLGNARILFLGDFAPTDAALPAIKKHGYGYQF